MAQNRLDALGLNPGEERIYHQLVTSRGGSARMLARVLRLPQPTVTQHLNRLVANGLVTESRADLPAYVPGRGVEPSGAREVHYLAEPPAATLGAIFSSRATGLINSGAAIERLSALYAGGDPSSDGPTKPVTLVEGERAVNQAAFDLISTAQVECLHLDRQPFVRADGPCALQPAMFDRMSNAVSVRTIYAGDVFRVAGYFEYMREAARLGEQGRLLTTLPIRFMLIDGLAALLPLASVGPWVSAAVVVRGHELIEDLTHVFEELWLRATPLSADDMSDHELSEEEIMLLRMLTTDMTDAAIGRHLGASVRTVGRRLANLQHKLGAQTRFAMGAEAARRGLL
jgi:DNA-binding CsgD family transcriptional regulator